jgi:hypothetical protein
VPNYTTNEGWDLIDTKSVEVEYYSGSMKVPGGKLTDEQLAAGDRIDYAHIVMLHKVDGTPMVRSIKKGEDPEKVAEHLRKLGHTDRHCTLL